MSDQGWRLQGRNGQVIGPVSEDHVRRGLRAGKIPLDTLAAPEDHEEWRFVRELPAFAPAVHEAQVGEAAPLESTSATEATSPALARVRPPSWPLFAVGVLGLLLALAAAWSLRARPGRTAEGISAQLLAHLKAGDVGALRARRELGQSARMAAEVQLRGTAELERRQRLLARAVETGERKLQEIAQKVRKVGEEAFQRLPVEEQQRILTGGDRGAWLALPTQERQQSAVRAIHAYVDEQGFAALSDAERAQLSSPRVFRADEALAERVRRQLGLATLAAEERAAVEALPPPGDDARQRFIEQHGTASLTAALREDMAAGGYSVEGIRYQGTSPHSLLRSTRAITTLQFDEERAVPARAWLPEQIVWRYAQGNFRADRDHGALPTEARAWLKRALEKSGESTPSGPASADEHDPLAAQAVASSVRHALRSPVSSLLGPDLLAALLLGAMSWLVLGRASLAAGSPLRTALRRDVPWMAGAVLVLAAVQHITEGQVSLDDWFFLPVLLALPCVAGARRGAQAGYVLGVVAGGVLLGVAALSRPAEAELTAVLPVGEFVLTALFFGLLGALSGVLAPRLPLVALLPCGWLLATGLLQRDALASPSPHGHVALAMSWTALLLAASVMVRRRHLG